MVRILRWQSKQRYYAAVLHRDLLGDVIVDRAWGGIGNNLGSSDTVVVPSEQAGEEVLAEIHARRVSRKYQLVEDKKLPQAPLHQ